MSFDIFARGTGMRHPFTQTGVSVGEWMDATDYLEYATGFGPNLAQTVIEQGGNYVGNQLDMQDEIVAALVPVGIENLSTKLGLLMIHHSPLRVNFGAAETATLFVDSSDYWSGRLVRADNPVQELMMGIKPVLEECNLLCMGVLSAIGDAFEDWESHISNSRDEKIININVRTEVIIGDWP